MRPAGTYSIRMARRRPKEKPTRETPRADGTRTGDPSRLRSTALLESIAPAPPAAGRELLGRRLAVGGLLALGGLLWIGVGAGRGIGAARWAGVGLAVALSLVPQVTRAIFRLL